MCQVFDVICGKIYISHKKDLSDGTVTHAGDKPLLEEDDEHVAEDLSNSV